MTKFFSLRSAIFLALSCAFLLTSCKSIDVSKINIMEVTAQGSPTQINAKLATYKTDFAAKLAKYGINSIYAPLKTNPPPPPNTLQYYFYPLVPDLFQAFGEAAGKPVIDSAADSVLLQVLPVESTPACQTTSCWLTTCGGSVLVCKKKYTCNTTCPNP